MMTKQKDIIQGSVYHYRFIDHGAQYRVYAILTADDLATNRVVKVPLTFDESKRVLQPHLRQLGLKNNEVEKRVHQLMLRKQQLPELIQGMFARDKKLMQSLGDVRLIPQLVLPQKSEPGYMLPLYFTQEYVIPMAEFMHPFRFMQQRPHGMTLGNVRQARQLFHAIVNLHYALWNYGISDMTFKLENIGIVIQNGKVIKAVLVDGAEHTRDVNEAKDVIEQQKWRNCLNPEKTDHLFLPVILHEEYVAIMRRGLTLKALRWHWQRKSSAIERRESLALRLRQITAHSKKRKLQLWIERQNLHDTLHTGIPQNRIDATNIPYADLQLLLEDTRAGKIPLDVVANQEKAERTMYANSDHLGSEIYRNTLRVSRDTY